MEIALGIDLDEVLAFTEGAEERLGDLTPYWEAAADPLIREFYEAVWASDGAIANGEPWAPLSDTTLALKARRGRADMGLLRDSDRLYDSLTKRGDAGSLRLVSPDAFFLGTAVTNEGAPYPSFLQRGWTMRSIFGRELAEPRNVPARPFVPESLPDTFADAIARTMRAYIATGALA